MAITAWKFATAFSDLCRFIKGKSVGSALGDITVAVIQIPRKTFVKAVHFEVTTVYTAGSTGSVIIGYEAPDKAASTNYFMANTVSLPLVAGMKTVAKGVYFEKGGMITVTFAKGDSAAHVVGRVFADTCTVF